MSLNINLTAPSSYVNAMVIGDPVATAGGSVDSIPTLPIVGGSPISAAIYMPTVYGALNISSMTTAQRNALNPNPGMIIYNASTTTFDAYFGGGINAWDNIAGGTDTFSRIFLGNGTAAAPSLSFSSDNTTGIYYGGATTLSFSTGGIETMALVDTTLNILGDGTNEGSIILKDELNGHFVGFAAPPSGSLTASSVYTLPTAHPAVNGVPLVSDAAGNLSFPLGGVQFVAGTITASQINNMYNTPVIIINALANLGVIVHRFVIETGTGTAPTGGGNVFLIWGNNPHNPAFAITDNITAASFTGAGAAINMSISSGKEYLGGVAAGNASSNNVYLTNDTALFAGSTFNAKVYVWYSYITLNPGP